MIDQGQRAEFFTELPFKPWILHRVIQLNLDYCRTIVKLAVMGKEDLSESAAAQFAHNQIPLLQQRTNADGRRHRLSGIYIRARVRSGLSGGTLPGYPLIHGGDEYIREGLSYQPVATGKQRRQAASNLRSAYLK